MPALLRHLGLRRRDAGIFGIATVERATTLAGPSASCPIEVQLLKLLPLLRESLRLAADVCPFDRQIQYRPRLVAGLKQSE